MLLIYNQEGNKERSGIWLLAGAQEWGLHYHNNYIRQNQTHVNPYQDWFSC